MCIRDSDKDNDNIEEIFLRGKTVLIDNLLLAEEQRGRYEFTGFHEGGHCILQDVYKRQEQIAEFCICNDVKRKIQILRKARDKLLNEMHCAGQLLDKEMCIRDRTGAYCARR